MSTHRVGHGSLDIFGMRKSTNELLAFKGFDACLAHPAASPTRAGRLILGFRSVSGETGTIGACAGGLTVARLTSTRWNVSYRASKKET